MIRSIVVILSLQFHLVVFSQTSRIFLPPEIMKAYEKETRSPDGMPGKNYYQNRADYNIDVEYFPDTRLVKGKGTIVFHNNSPDHLSHIVLRLYQNIFLKGGVRGRKVNPEDLHDGMIIRNIEITIQRYQLNYQDLNVGTNLILPFQLNSGKKANIYLEWEFTMPAKTTNRFGCYGPASCFIAYWYPQVSVYDDINGWDLSGYTGVAEFYNNYGDFNVNITVPRNFIIWATGELTNPDKVLNEKYLNRYNDAKTSDKVVHIIEKSDLNKKTDITKKGKNTWRFTAINVNDFAFGLSNNYLWDATSVEIEQKEGKKRVFIETAYDKSSKNFRQVAEISAWSVKDFSVDLPGIPYPYPRLTTFNGRGGMEFPMIMNNGEADYAGTLFVTTHEIGHTYFPFLVGTNQNRHGWIDEGLVTVIAQEQHLKREQTYNIRNFYLSRYPALAGTQEDVPPIVNSGYITDDIFQIHEYMRPSLAFWILRDILGHELFKKCVAGFIEVWEGKHPTPWDMFNIFEKISGRRLDWFFSPWFCEFAYPDLEIVKIDNSDDEGRVIIRNSGGMPFPAQLRIWLNDGTEKILPLPAEVWMDNAEYVFRADDHKIITAAEIITAGHPDVNVENNYMRAVITE